MARSPIPRTQAWTPPAARVEGDRLLKMQELRRRTAEAERQARDAEARVDTAVKEATQANREVDDVRESIKQLRNDIPKIVPGAGAGRRGVKKILERYGEEFLEGIAVLPDRQVTAGTGLTGGGDLTEDRSIALSAETQTSLGKADTAMQPADVAEFLEDVEEARDIATAAAIAAFANRNDATLLLGTNNGTAIDATANDYAARGGVTPETGILTDGLEHSRNSREWGFDADGYLTVFDAETPVFPSRDGGGAHNGIAIRQPMKNEIFYSDDLSTAAGWTHSTGLTVGPSTEIDPFGGTDAFLLTDTDGAGFSHLLRTDIEAEDDEYGCMAFFAKAGTSSRVQAKPLFFDGSETWTMNVTFDLETGTVTAVQAEGYMIALRNGWWLCVLLGQNNATGNTGLNWRLYPDIAATENTGNIHFMHPMWFRNARRFPGYIAPQDRPKKPALTGTKWNTIAGSTTLGTFVTTNEANQDLTNAAWTKSNLTVTAVPGESLSGAGDAYILDDTSAAALGFTQFTKATGVGTAKWATFGFVIDTDPAKSDGYSFQIRPNFYNGGTVITPVIEIDLKVKEVKSISLANVYADMIPVSGTKYLVVCWFQNNSTGNTGFRMPIYPGAGVVANQWQIQISDVFIVLSDAELWTADDFESIDADHTYIDLTGKDYTGLSGTVAVDLGDIDPMLPGTSNAATLLSIDKGTANGRILLRLQTLDVDAGTYSLVGQFISDAGVIASLVANDVELAAARWWIAWGPAGAAIGRDDMTLASSSDASVRPTGATKINVGQTYLGTGTINADMKRIFHRPVYMTGDSIHSAGRYDFLGFTPPATSITEEQLDDMADRAIAASIALKARTRTGIVTAGILAAKTYALLNGAASQSFLRAAVTASPPVTDKVWYAAQESLGVNWLTPLMLGGSVRPTSATGTTFTQVSDYDGLPGGTGAAGFNPLVATTDAGGAVLDTAQLEAGYGTYSSSYSGESPIVSFAYEFTRSRNAALGLVAPNTTGIIIPGVPGSSTDSTLAGVLGEDSPADSDVWQKMLDYVDQVITEAGGSSNISYFATAIHHGESMYGLNATMNDYLYGKSHSGMEEAGIGMIAGLDNLKALALSEFGQAETPLAVVSVPSMKWMRDGCEVGKAWDWLEENRDEVVIASASYMAQPGATNNEHPSPNGSVLLGLHEARASSHILYGGSNYFIPKPFEVVQVGKGIAISFLAMDYPMKFKEWFTAYDPSNLGYVHQMGFRITLNGQVYELASDWTIHDSGAVIYGTLLSTPSDYVTVDYAGATTSGGHGNLFDSASDFTAWEWRQLAFMNPEVEVAALSGEVMPGERGCRPFRMVAAAPA